MWPYNTHFTQGETSLKPKEERLLASINKAYYLPKWCSVADYVTYCKEAGLEDIRRDDWTEHIKVTFI
jgi:tocopherol O-methyltransferase